MYCNTQFFIPLIALIICVGNVAHTQQPQQPQQQQQQQEVVAAASPPAQPLATNDQATQQHGQHQQQQPQPPQPKQSQPQNSESIFNNLKPQIKFEAPAQGQLSQHRQIAQVGQMILNGVQQLTAAGGPMLSSISIAGPLAGIGTASGSHTNNVGLFGPTSSRSSSNQQAATNVESNNTSSPSSSSSSLGLAPNKIAQSFNEQGEILRHEIITRANQLQSVVTSSLNSLRNNSDLIVRRVLEQMSVRLDHARAKADRILSEPANNEIAVKALATVNNGLTNVNNIITNLVRKLDPTGSIQTGFNNNNNTAINQLLDNNLIKYQVNSGDSSISQRVGPSGNLDGSSGRFPFNLHQIRQQFSSAISAVQKQQQQQQQQSQSQQQQQTSLLSKVLLA